MKVYENEISIIRQGYTAGFLDSTTSIRKFRYNNIENHVPWVTKLGYQLG